GRLGGVVEVEEGRSLRLGLLLQDAGGVPRASRGRRERGPGAEGGGSQDRVAEPQVHAALDADARLQQLRVPAARVVPHPARTRRRLLAPDELRQVGLRELCGPGVVAVRTDRHDPPGSYMVEKEVHPPILHATDDTSRYSEKTSVNAMPTRKA